MRVFLCTFVAVCGLCAFAAQSASAALFTDQSTFLTAAGGGLSFESFEGEPTSGSSLASIVVADFTVTTAPDTNLNVLNVPVNGAHATDGSKYVRWIAGAGSNFSVAFNLDQPATAFGVTLTDALDYLIGGRTFSLFLDNGSSYVDFLVSPLPDANERFVGVTEVASFSQLIFTLTSPLPTNEGLGFDEVYYGAAVPEPAALTLVALSLAGLLLASRRRFFSASLG